MKSNVIFSEAQEAVWPSVVEGTPGPVVLQCESGTQGSAAFLAIVHLIKVYIENYLKIRLILILVFVNIDLYFNTKQSP